MTTTKRPRKKPAAPPAKKARRTTTKKAAATSAAKTRSTGARKAKATTVAEPLNAPVAVAVTPLPEPAPAIAPPEAVVVTSVPEPAFAARTPPPEPPRLRPATRRGIFFDVENTSRAEDIGRVLAHLAIDWVGVTTEFMAIGNWRVIGHDTARLLAGYGAKLVHSAPSAGVRDWSDLRIAVSAGVWLASAHPGDVIEIVSDDQAFDAVGDVATSLGVTFRRTSYRALAGRAEAQLMPEAAEARPRRSRRGGRRPRPEQRPSRSDRVEREPVRAHETARHETHRAHESGRAPAAATHDAGRAHPVPARPPADVEPHTAPHDEIVEAVSDLMRTSPAGISLDALANALKARGFSRPPGSPRLITRLRRIRELAITRNGLIKLGDEHAHERRHAAHHEVEPPITPQQGLPPAPPPAREEIDTGAAARAAGVAALAPPHAAGEPGAEAVDEEAAFRAWTEGRLEVPAARAASEDDEAAEVDDVEGEDEAPAEAAASGEAGENGGRRRRRRGGRRRRGRRGGQGSAPAEPS